MIIGKLLLLSVSVVLSDDDETQFHLPLEERKVIDASIDKAAQWLLKHQAERVTASPIEHQETSSVLLTSMILWTLSEARSPRLDVASGFALCGVLLENRQSDGGIYHMGGGLELYESTAAERAFDAFQRYYPESEIQTMLPPLREAILSFRALTRGRVPELSDAIHELQGNTVGLTQGERDALRFLSSPGLKNRGAGADDAPRRLASRRPFIFEALARDDPRSLQALKTLKPQLILGDPLPSLIAGFGEASFLPPEPELQFSNLAVALTLTRRGDPMFACADGSSIDWPRILSRKTLTTTEVDGSWKSTGATWQTNPILVTCYALNTLRLCRDAQPEVRVR